MSTNRGQYQAVQHIPDDGSDFDDEDLNMVEKPRKARKGLAVMIALSIVVAFGLAGSFFLAAKPHDASVYTSKPGKVVRKALEKADIIDEVIPKFHPVRGLSVNWESKSLHAQLGNTLKPKDLQSAPEVSLTDLPDSKHDERISSLPSSNIILAMTDPDAPSRHDPKWSEHCHWLATGVVCADSSGSSKKATSREELISYQPPGPPPKTGKHRYVFLVLIPANGTTEPLDLKKPSGRHNWGYGEERTGVHQWADEMGLKPIAANFIYAENAKQ